MITIHKEITIDLGTADEACLTFWGVSYGPPPNANRDADTGADMPDYWPVVLEALRRFCAHQGWLLECGDDPYQERSLALFGEGFFWPPEMPEDDAGDVY